MSSNQSSSSLNSHPKSDQQQKKDQQKKDQQKSEQKSNKNETQSKQQAKQQSQQQQSQQQEPQQQQQSNQVSQSAASSSPAAYMALIKDFYKKKIFFYFTEILDLNSDGYFDSNDIENCKHVYKNARKIKTDSAEFEKFSKFLNKWLNVIKELTQKERAYREQWLAAAIEAHQKEMEKKAKEAAASNASKDKETKEKDAKEKKEDKEKLKQLEEQQKPKLDPNLITLDDFYKFMEHIRPKFENKKQFPKSLSYMEDYAEALFNLVDLDRDGYVTKKDFLAEYLNAEDLKSREKAWSLMTEKDESKKFNKKQFEELVIEFLTSTDSKDRGNWIFGYFE